MKKILAILALIIALPVSAAQITIQEGDTLHKIAQSFNSTVSQLLQINPQIENPDLIYAGADLEVPDTIRGADLYYQPIFGGNAGIPITDYETTLTTSLTSTGSTINVASVATTDSHTLTTADISPAIYLVLDSDSTTKKEIVKCIAISGSAFTGCTRGLAFYGAETEVAGNKHPHSAGSTVVLSDVHLLFVSLNAAQDWSRIQTYNVFPESGVGSAPTTTNQFTPKSYVDALAQQGGATSTEAITGITQLGTQLEMASSTFSATVPTVVYTKYTTSSPDVRGLYIPVAENDGYLNQGWIDLTENFDFTGNNTFATSTTATSTITDLTVSSSTIDTLTVGSLIGATQFQRSFTAGETITAGEAVIVKYENEALQATWAGADDADQNIAGSTWKAQTFLTSATAAGIKRVSFTEGGGTGSGTYTVSIRATSGGEPTGADLGVTTIPNGSGEVTFDIPIPVSPNTTYALVMRDSNAGSVGATAAGGYADGATYTSSNSGSTWSLVSTVDCLFTIYEVTTVEPVIYLADASSDNVYANNFIGFADETITSGNSGNFTIQGIDDNQSSLQIGEQYFLSDISGEISLSAGSQSRLIGRALSATEIKIINDF